MNILVTGGAGYIGSMMTKQLIDAGHAVVVYDNLSTGNKSAVHPQSTYINGDLDDRQSLEKVFNSHSIEAVIHFAGVLVVAESMHDPGKYFMNNTAYTVKLLEVMKQYKVSRIVFSSTAGVYGNPDRVPIPEDHPTRPTHVYGESKLMIEKVLQWYDRIYQIRSISLRYFNAAGASRDGNIGELHKHETHIIPLAMQAAMNQSVFTLYGTDYDTKDGTCIRDYIHIEDLCDAHVKALEYIEKKDKSELFNVGTGIGYSNREVVDEIMRVTGKTIRVKQAERRTGDPDQLIADPSKIKKELGWKPQYSDLQTIINTAWNFHSAHGFGQ